MFFLVAILFFIILFACLGRLLRPRRWIGYGYYRPYRPWLFSRRPYMRRDFYGDGFHHHHHHHHGHHHHHHGGW